MITKIHKKEIIDHSIKFKTARNLSPSTLGPYLATEIHME